MRTEHFTAENNFSRADVALSERLTDYTRSALKKLFEGGLVTINGKPAKPAQSVCTGDNISVQLPDPVECVGRPEDIPIEIIYEDNDVAVINKPQGLTVHAGNGNLDGTLVNALLYKLDNLSGIGGVIRPGIVHRIDKNTSGLLVVAKNDKAHLSLAEQIAEKSCRRTYVALLEGNLKEDSGTVTTYIGRSQSDRTKMAVVPPEKGKLAITDYTVLDRAQGYTLCRFDLQTGRTHQIRVHAKHLNHPIVGDDVYGRKKREFSLEGQLLHAFRLEFTHPTSGQRLSFTAPLPEYFQAVLKKLKLSFNLC
ncbi:MAG: RluA family pseudouridine synthase [Clostridia bacterium]|nr:RluA family pseudouridine synthase [Clostridia bacterium]